LSEAEEIALIEPVVRALAGTTVSVDTWRPAVVEAVLEAGAAIVNDVSGLADPEVANLAARHGAGLVIMHTRAAPKERAFPGYESPVDDVISFLSERIESALQAGVRPEQIILDPGLDYTKTPHETIEVLRGLDELQSFGRPILLAVSRKYFLGMITGRPPEYRLPATLAAIQFGISRGAAILRVHDVAEVAEFLRVARALPGEDPVALTGDPHDRGLMWIAPKHA
jgi:dihydropteroate synthase